MRILDEVLYMVEKTKEESAKEVYIAFRSVFITERVKRVVQPQERQKVRDKE